MEKKLREIANAIIDYVIEGNLPIQLDNIYVYNDAQPFMLRPYYLRVHGIFSYINEDGNIVRVVDHIYNYSRTQHYFIVRYLTEEEFNELVDDNKLRKRFL